MDDALYFGEQHLQVREMVRQFARDEVAPDRGVACHLYPAPSAPGTIAGVSARSPSPRVARSRSVAVLSGRL